MVMQRLEAGCLLLIVLSGMAGAASVGGCGNDQSQDRRLDAGDIHQTALWAEDQIAALGRARSGANTPAEAGLRAELQNAVAEFVGTAVTWNSTVARVSREEVFVDGRRELISGFPITVYFSREDASVPAPETIAFRVGTDISAEQALGLRQHTFIRLEGVVTSAELLERKDGCHDYAIRFTVSNCVIAH